MAKSKVKTTKKEVVEKLQKEDKLSLTLSLNDEAQKVSGKDVSECMEKIKLPVAPATPALFNFKQGKVELQLFVHIAQMRRYITNPGARVLLQDNWQGQLNTLA